MRNLQGLLAFVEAAALGSFSAAAERLEVTPAAVSKSVAKLEQQVGVRLFQRTTRRLSLTEEGGRFVVDARAALRQLDEAVASVSQSAQVPAGRVRISAGIAFGRTWLLNALPAIAVRYPQVGIDVDLDNRPIDLVARGYDIGIRGGLIDDSNLIARRVCALPLVLVASPAYLADAGVPATPAALAAHRCAGVRFANGTVPTWRFFATDDGAPPTEWTPAPQLTTSDPETVIELALAGAGIVQAGLHHALPWLRAGQLKLLLAGVHDPGDREVVVHYPHRRYLAPRVRVVVDALLSHFEATADLHVDLAGLIAERPDCIAVAPPRLRR